MTLFKAKRHRIPKYVEIHRDGVFHQKEINALLNVAEKYNVEIAIVSISKSGAPVFLRRENDTLKNPQTTYIEIPDHTGNHYALATFSLPITTINPLNVRIIKGNHNKILEHLIKLCYLNFANWKATAGLPITVHNAHKIANYHRKGIFIGGNLADSGSMYYL